MSGIMDGLRSFYFSLEDKYYSLLDKVQKVIPVYSVVDPVDKIIPSFILFAALVLLLIVGAGLALGGGLPTFGSPQTVAVSVTFTDDSGVPVSGATVTFTSLGDTPRSYDQVTDDSGAASFDVIPGDYTVSASADGFDDFSQDITVKDAKQLQFQLSPTVAPTKSRALIITDEDGSILGSLSPVTISLSFACQSGTPPADQTVFKGTISVIQPAACIGLAVTITVNGFVTKSQPILGDTTTIQLQSQDEKPTPDVPTKGSVEVTVKDKANVPVSGVQFKLYKTSTGSSDVLANQSLSDTGGFALITDVSPGLYNLTATKQGYKIYTSASFQVNAGEKNTITASLEKSSTSKKFFVKILSSEDQTPVVGATVIVFLQANGGKYLEDGTYTTDINGEIEQPVGDVNSNEQVVISKSGFVTEIVSNQGIMLADNTTPIPILVDPTEAKGTNGNIPNALIANIKVLDLLGFPVNGADTTLYTPDLNGVYVAKKKTGSDGIAKYENLPAGPYQARASTSSADGTSATVSGNVNSSILLPITIDNGTALVEVTVKDSFNKPLADTNVLVYNATNNLLLSQGLTNSTGVATLSVKTVDSAFVRTVKTGYIPFNSVPFGIIKDNTHKITAEMSLASSTPSLDMELLSIYELSTTGTKTLASALVPGATYEFHFSVKAPVDQTSLKSLVRVNPISPAALQPTDVAALTGGKTAKGGLLFFTQTNASDEFSPPVSSATTSEGPAKIVVNGMGSTLGSGAYEVIVDVAINANAFPGTDKLELAYQTKSDSTLSALHVESYTIGNPLPPQGDFGYLFFISLSGSNQKTQVSSAQPVKIEANKEYTLDYLITNASGTNFPTATIGFTFPSGTVTPPSATLPGFVTNQSVSGSVKVKATVPCTACSSLTATLSNVGTGKSPLSYTLNMKVTPEKQITLKATPTFLIPGLTQVVSVVAVDNDGNPLNASNLVQVTGLLKKANTPVPFTGSPQGIFIASIDKDAATDGEVLEMTGTAPGYLSDTLSVPISNSLLSNFSQDFSCITFTPTAPFFTPPSNGSVTVKTTNCLESLKLYTTGDGPLGLVVKNGSSVVQAPNSSGVGPVSLNATDSKTLSLSLPAGGPASFGLFPMYVYAKYDSQPNSAYVKINALDVQVNPSGTNCLTVNNSYVVDLSDGSDSAEVVNNCNPLVKDPFLPAVSLNLDGTFAHVLPSVITPELVSGASVPFSWQVKVAYGFSNTDAVTLNDIPNTTALSDAKWNRYMKISDSFLKTFDDYAGVDPVLITDMVVNTSSTDNGVAYLEHSGPDYPFYYKNASGEKKSILYTTTFIAQKKTKFQEICVMVDNVENVIVRLDGATIHNGPIGSCDNLDAGSKNVTVQPGPHQLSIYTFDSGSQNYWVRVRAEIGGTFGKLSNSFAMNPLYGSPFVPDDSFSGTLSYPTSGPKSETLSLSNKSVPVKIGTLVNSDGNPIRNVLTNANGGEQLKKVRLQTYSSNPAVRVFVKDYDVYAQYVGFDEPALKQNIVFENTGLTDTHYAVLSLSDYTAKNTGTKDLYAAVLLDGSSSVLLNMDDLPNATDPNPTQNGLCTFLSNLEDGLTYYSNATVHFKFFIMNQPSSFTGAPCGASILTVPIPPGFNAATQSSEEFWGEGAKAISTDPFWGGQTNLANKLLIVVTDTKASGSSGLYSAYDDAVESALVNNAGDQLANAGIRAAVLYKTSVESNAVTGTASTNKAIASYAVFSSKSLGTGFSPSDGLVEALDYSQFILPTPGSSSSLVPFENAQNNKVVQRLAQFAYAVDQQKIAVKVIAPPLSACVGGNGEIGTTGTVGRPKILLNWGWNEQSGVASTLCDAQPGSDAGTFAYCDATQFTITLVKKLEALRQALGASATPAQIAQIPFLKTFDAYLIRDQYSDDFRSDFVALNTSTSFADAPSYFVGSTSGEGAWKDYVNQSGPLKLRLVTDDPSSTAPLTLPYSGLYRVQIEYGSPTFFAAGSPATTITVTLKPLANAKSLSNYSELYELPFDGLVGLKQTGTGSAATYQLARNGYGVGFAGTTDVTISTKTKFVALKTYSSEAGSTPFVPITVSRVTDFVGLNTGASRGVGVEYNPSASTLIIRAAVPTPVLAEWSSNSSGKGEFYYGINENIVPNPGTFISYNTSAGPLAKWVPVASQNKLPTTDCASCNICLDAGNNPFDLSVLADHNPTSNQCTGFNSQLNGSNSFGFSSPSGTANTSYLSTVFYHNPENGSEYKMVAACNPSATGIPEGKFATPVSIGSQNAAAVLDMDSDDLLTYQSTLSVSDLLDLISNPASVTAEGWACVASKNNTTRVYWNEKRLRQYVFDKWAGNNFGVLTSQLSCNATGTPLFSGDFWTLTQQTQSIPSLNATVATKMCPLYNNVASAGQYNQLGVPYPVGSKVFLPGDAQPDTGDPVNALVQYRFNPTGCSKTGNGVCGSSANKVCTSNSILVWEN